MAQVFPLLNVDQKYANILETPIFRPFFSNFLNVRVYLFCRQPVLLQSWNANFIVFLTWHVTNSRDLRKPILAAILQVPSCKELHVPSAWAFSPGQRWSRCGSKLFCNSAPIQSPETQKPEVRKMRLGRENLNGHRYVATGKCPHMINKKHLDRFALFHLLSLVFDLSAAKSHNRNR